MTNILDDPTLDDSYLAKIRIGTDYESADCKKVLTTMINPDDNRFRVFNIITGFDWLTVCILHVLYYEKINNNGRIATVREVFNFMMLGHNKNSGKLIYDHSFFKILNAMAKFDHKRDVANKSVKMVTGKLKKYSRETSWIVHSHAIGYLITFCDARYEKISNTLGENNKINFLSSNLIHHVKPKFNLFRENTMKNILDNQTLDDSYLAKIRIGTDHEYDDCQNIALMMFGYYEVGLKGYWMNSGLEWFTVCILHILYYEKIKNNRIATLKDIHHFMLVGHSNDDIKLDSIESFNQLFNDMAKFDHGRGFANEIIKVNAYMMMDKLDFKEILGVHNTAKFQLNIILNKNTDTKNIKTFR